MVIAPNSTLIIKATILSLLIVSATTYSFAYCRSLGYMRGAPVGSAFPCGSFLSRARFPIFQRNSLKSSTRSTFGTSFDSKVSSKGRLSIAFISTTNSQDMPRAFPTLQEFLHSRKRSPTPHVVIGNEAGDADSVISAICYAYVQEFVNPSRYPITPVVSISGNDLQTQRPETVRLLQLAGISLQEHLCYVNDAAVLRSDADTSLLNITLVDHNRLSVNRPYLNASNPNNIVVGVLDHHLDEGYHIDTCVNRNIAYQDSASLVASTCTLIVEEMQLDDGCLVVSPIPASLSLLLLGVILLDSLNMDPNAGKVTDRDVAAIQTLVRHTDWQDLDQEARTLLDIGNIDPDPSPNLTSLFQELQNAKFSPTFWKELSVYDALRLDYKQFSPSCLGAVNALGVSTVLLSRSEFGRKPDILPGICSYMKELQIDLFGIMFAYSSESVDNPGNTVGLTRELTLVGSNRLLMNRLIEFLLQEGSLQLKEVPETHATLIENSSDQLTIRSFQQMNSAASRKQVVPLFMKFFEENIA